VVETDVRVTRGLLPTGETWLSSEVSEVSSGLRRDTDAARMPWGVGWDAPGRRRARALG
jgi:hypothetical protein